MHLLLSFNFNRSIGFIFYFFNIKTLAAVFLGIKVAKGVEDYIILTVKPSEAVIMSAFKVLFIFFNYWILFRLFPRFMLFEVSNPAA